MNSKKLVWIFMFIGSAIGGFIPSLWGADAFSLSPMIFGSLGAIVGIYIGYKMSR